MTTNESTFLWRRFTLREAILLGFCATFVVLTRAGLRLHLHLPGHVMFFTMFFLILARAWVPKVGAAALVGLIASLAGMLLGMGKGGPLVLLKFLLPALIVEAGAFVYPVFAVSWWACATIGVLAAATRVAATTGVEWFIGMEEEIILGKALLNAAATAGFGALGSLLVPPVVRRLRANGLISHGRKG
ncbi:MAG: hypothetical protein HYS23_13030 [Geobacter sp.]|nr:hypothetical protein [Geobacter sp.]